MKKHSKKGGHRCLECGAELTEKRAPQPYGLAGDWSVVVEDAIITTCPNCPGYGVGFENVEQLERAVVAAVVNKHGRLAPEEIRFLRTRLGLEAKTLAARLGVTASTMSRWERGREPIGATPERLLRALAALAERDNAGFDPSVLDQIDAKDGRPLQLTLRRNAKGEWHRVAA